MSASKGPIIVGVIIAVIVGVLGFILFGFDTNPPENTVDYNYYEFEEVGGLWQTTLVSNGQSYLAVFRFHPNQTEEVYLTGKFTGFKKRPLYITFDPTGTNDEFRYLTLGVTELSLHLIRGMGFQVEAACTKNETDACMDRKIITCDSDESVIYLVPKAPTQITLDGDCVTLSGDKMELLKSVDRLLFQWYKIIR